MKIKIELYLPFQKLEQYNIETDIFPTISIFGSLKTYNYE